MNILAKLGVKSKVTTALATAVTDRIENSDQTFQSLDSDEFVADAEFITNTVSDTRSAMVIYRDADSLGRSRGIFARLNEWNLCGGSPVPPPIKVPGCDPKAGLTRGHLLGGMLGGSGERIENLTPIYRLVNVSQMKRIECAVRDAVHAGETVDYRVTPIYESDALIPKYIRIEARGSRGFVIQQSLENKP